MSHRKKETSYAKVARKSDNNPNADPLWHKENEMLQADAEANSRLREEITKQSYADSAIQVGIQDKITHLKDKAVHLAKNLEAEKRKNIELEAIIRHMKYTMDEEKKVEANHRDDMNFQNMDNLTRKIKKLEYDLEQMFSKSNDLNSKNKSRKNQIDASRTQRVIDSGIFLKLEKEVVRLEMEYKKLLIEKTKYEKQYLKNLQNYKKMKQDIQREQSTTVTQRQSVDRRESMGEKSFQDEQFFVNAPEIHQAVKFTEITENKKKSMQVKRFSQTVDKIEPQKSEEQQYLVKKIFMETGLSTPEQLIDHLYNIEQKNVQLFKEVNQKCDRVSEIKTQITKMRVFRKLKTVKYYEKQPEMTKAEIEMKNSMFLSDELSELEATSTQQTTEIHTFMKQKETEDFWKMLLQANNKESLNNDQDSLDSVFDLFVSLEKKMNPILQQYLSFKENLLTTENEEIEEIRPKISSKDETVDDLMNRIKKIQQSQKIMGREQFKKQYENVKKASSKNSRYPGKKRTTIIRRTD